MVRPAIPVAPPGVQQAFRFAPTDAGHIRRLLGWADLPAAAQVLDLGAGDGSTAAQMQECRPDLSFCLVDKARTVGAGRLNGPRWRTHCADLCSVPESDAAFDAVLCSYAKGYAVGAEFFREVSRLARPGAVVFIVDMVPRASVRPPVALFGYTIDARAIVEAEAGAAGLVLDFYMEPLDNSGFGEARFPGLFELFFDEVRPAIWRFTRS